MPDRDLDDDVKETVRRLVDCLQVALLLADRLDAEHAALRDAVVQAVRLLTRFKAGVTR